MYYSQIRVDPSNAEIVFLGGAPAFKSVDGGKTFQTIQNLAHSDHHAIWINPKNGNHVMYGNDGGLDVSYDQGRPGTSSTRRPRGSSTRSAPTCGSLTSCAAGCRTTGRGAGRAPSGTRWASSTPTGSAWAAATGSTRSRIPTDWTIVYAESQDGAVNRLDLRKGTTTSIRPRAPRAAGQSGPSPEQLAQMAAQFGMSAPSTASNVVPAPPAGEAFRFFWNTPTVLSPHNPEHRVGGRQPAVQVLQPRRHLDDVAGPHAQPQPLHAADHGRGGRCADGVEARRRGDDVGHHHRRGIAGGARPRVGRHQRRQPPGQP